ncbi:MAG: hypothetical protein PF517_02390 [Salinivirgaceae bacterium]|jgi:hypothetical protein|nr:hypothetical protein [Salinivirgaceae bacterium]
MESNNKNFLKELDELINLFEKLRQKATKEGVILKDDPMYKNFELLAGNYKLIKNNIPPELIEEMGGPIKEMISEMVNQLKEELGGDASNSETETPLQNELHEIDLLLKNGNLSEDEINKLLDKRKKLNNEG